MFWRSPGLPRWSSDGTPHRPPPTIRYRVISGSAPTAFFEVLNDVAEQAGFFKAEHLTIDDQYASAAAIAVQSVGAGKADIGAVGTEPLIQGYEHGVRMMAFFSRDPHLQQVIGVLDSSPIRTLADFKGASIGELSLGQSGEYYTNVMLAGAGLKKTDYSFAAIGAGAQSIQALVTKRVDAAAFPYPALRIDEIIGNVKFRYFYEPLLKDVSDVAYVATPATIATKADALRRFTRAIVKSAILIRVNPALAAKYFAQANGQPATGAATENEVRLLTSAADSLPGFDPASMRIGDVSLRGTHVLAQFMYDNGITTQLVPAEAVATNQFTAYANAFDHRAFIAQA